MNFNGLIIQKKDENYYKGIDGDNWYLNWDGFNELDDYFEENIEKASKDIRYVDVCNDMEYMQKYINLSKNIKYRVLACMTEREFPQMMSETKLNMFFLGYDYAYSGGSYYSAVLNDIISKRILEFTHIKLNSNGLFDSFEEILDFVNLRNKIKKEKTETKCSQAEYIEDGDYVIYKLFEVRS